MRFNLLSQEEGLYLAEEGGDGLSHLSEFIPSPLLKSTAPEISQGRVLTPWEEWEQEGARKTACIYPPCSFCQVLVANTAESLELQLLTLRCPGSSKGTARACG